MDVKGKKCLCKTLLSGCNVERVNDVEFYKRYSEYVALFSAHIPNINFQECFAQPVFDEDNRCVEWFYVPTTEDPYVWSKEGDSKYVYEKNRIITAIEEAYQSLGENERIYLNAILTTLKSDIVNESIYCHDGIVTFGYWGLRPKKGIELNTIIINDVRDHRTHTIQYAMRGSGSLSFDKCIRIHGHVIDSEKDVPQVTANDGFSFTRWEPDSPFGQVVTRDLLFTAVCEKVSTPQQSEDKYVVHFDAGEHGNLIGNIELLVDKGHILNADEIPSVQPEDGFRFVGWKKNPHGYVVNEDTTFIAQYKTSDVTKSDRNGWMSFWGGWHNLLQTLLLLALLGLLLWFLFGHHNIHFCGCDCGKTEFVDTIPNVNPDDHQDLDPDKRDPLIQEPCKELECDGSNVPQSFLFEMGQPSGEFLFEYATGGRYADNIVIYDGPTRHDKVIFTYHDITGDDGWNNKLGIRLRFHSSQILVDIIPDEDTGTWWKINVNCPE